ncbi:MAG: hypothetical protein A3H27_07810 [Acidobacteria bacterium RIFCSPLOWO2_02_FULL_59_13]|nr:MAG: hypothetical protein A3H27_07810 [Acidobacteria bacterium RIFCSPLOWO2_02_FULL_59_13]
MADEKKASGLDAQPTSPTGSPTKHVSNRVQQIYDILARRDTRANTGSESFSAAAEDSPEFGGESGDGK